MSCLLQLQLLSAASSPSPGRGDDEGALMAFKAKLSHGAGGGALASWNRNTSYCSWEGVTCGERHRWRVIALDLSSQGLTGTISPAIGNLTFLRSLNLSLNILRGDIPPGIGALRRLDLSQNALTGAILSNITGCTELRVMAISSNRLRGSIPAGIGDSWDRRHAYSITASLESSLNLLEFGIGGKRFSGTLPLSMTNLSSLQILYLTANSFTGVVPSALGKLQNLEMFSLDDNMFEARNEQEWGFVASLTNCSRLRLLSVGWNMLSGKLPSSLGKNSLEGPIPPIGQIPDTIANCGVLEVLFMDDNSFQGSIPVSLKNMAGLTLLNLTNNKLNGSIPGDLGSITNLQQLYLAHNNLSGPIPENLGNAKSLLHLDLSFNNLQGEVPTEGVFRNLTGLSIVGNSELCGGIQELHLPKCPNKTARKNQKSMPKSLTIVVPTVGALLLLLSGLALAGIFYRKSKAGLEKEMSSQFTNIELTMVPYNDILKGTDGFSEANVLGKGRYGTVYRGALENPAIVVPVKVFNLKLSGTYKSFRAECEALRRVRHRCLVKIFTCCSSINHQGEDFRALVFEFMPNGSLNRWIHSDFGSQNGKGALTLSQMLDIAIDIVDALGYLHNGCQPSIIHCDLKPSNILLNQDMRARVGDFGIARIVDEATSKQPRNSNSSIGIRGSIGYIAPDRHA
ncbi:hypothetical protein ACP4OV_023529 [Aristida adscensionis]